MQIIDMQEADSQLSELVANVESGETILLARDGDPVAKLSRFERSKPVARRTPAEGFGLLKGRSEISDDIKTPFAAEIEEMYYGNSDKFRE